MKNNRKIALGSAFAVALGIGSAIWVGSLQSDALQQSSWVELKNEMPAHAKRAFGSSFIKQNFEVQPAREAESASVKMVPEFLRTWAAIADKPLPSAEEQILAGKEALEKVPQSVALVSSKISAQTATADWAVQSRAREYAVEAILSAMKLADAKNNAAFNDSLGHFIENCAAHSSNFEANNKIRSEASVYLLGYFARIAVGAAQNQKELFASILGQGANQDAAFFKYVNKKIEKKGT